jgi:hypothetical protein
MAEGRSNVGRCGAREATVLQNMFDLVVVSWGEADEEVGLVHLLDAIGDDILRPGGVLIDGNRPAVLQCSGSGFEFRGEVRKIRGRVDT